MQWITDFKVKEADTIRARHVQPCLEEPSPEADADVRMGDVPSDHDEEVVCDNQVLPETIPSQVDVVEANPSNQPVSINAEDAT